MDSSGLFLDDPDFLWDINDCVIANSTLMISDWSTRFLRSTVVFSALALPACAGMFREVPPTPSPVDTNLSVVGISLRGGGAFAPGVVYFLRMQDGQDIASGSQVIASNYWTTTDRYEQQFYLLNAEPGRYVVVGCARVGREKWSKPSEFTLFRQQAIGITQIEVEPGQIGFMGEFDLAYPFVPLLFSNSPDEAQRHYYELMAGKASYGFWNNFATYYLAGKRFLSATLLKDQEERGEKFAISVTEDIRQGSWANLIVDRLIDSKTRAKTK